jgi:uncharacterized membrane protein
MSYLIPSSQPVLARPLRWAVRVVAWLAFGICAYLAWNAVTHGAASVCLPGSADCDVVQSSRWSLWLGIPVAIVGLACYAALASLSVMTGLSSPRAVRWIGTLLVAYSLLVSLGGLWFTGLQLFMLQKFCLWCIALHICGWTITALVIWGLVSRPQSAPVARPVPAGAGPVRPVAPSVPGTFVPRAIRPAVAATAMTGRHWVAAGAGAIAVFVALVGGQFLLPADMSHREVVALDQPVELDTKATAEPADPHDSLKMSASSQSHTANRIPIEIPTRDAGVIPTAAQVDEKAQSESTAKLDIPDAHATESATAKQAETPAPVELSPKRERRVSFLGNTVTLDMYQHPVLGNREAKQVVLEFVSYDCSHCRQMHRIVHKALNRYGDQVAVVVLTVPADAECNKEVAAKNSITGACATARMAIGVATLEPTKFADFHNWLMSGKDKPPSASQAVTKAYGIVGRERIKDARDKLQKQIAQYVDLFIRIRSKTADPKKVGLPLMVVGNQILSGSQESDEKLFKIWEENLGIKPLQARDLPAL